MFLVSLSACSNSDSEPQTTIEADKSTDTVSTSAPVVPVVPDTPTVSETVEDQSSDLVEIMLVDKLDESRGYCLDIAGGQGARAPIERGLQAHTCYNYRGEILEDQGFDSTLINTGQFKISYFDVCMTVASITAGTSLSLEACNGSENQTFTLNDSGQLVVKSAPELCVTLDSSQQKTGRGGTPPHVMHPVSIEACDDAKQAYQTWSLNSL